MFEELSVEQIQAARAALAKPLNGSPNTSTKRVFNLDVSIIYYTNIAQQLTSRLSMVQIAKLLYGISLLFSVLLLTSAVPQVTMLCINV